MMTTVQRFMIRLALGLALSVAAVPAHASVIFDTGAVTFSPEGTQFGRIARDGEASNWADPKPFPGVTGAPTPRSYQTFTIDSDVFPFIQILFDDPAAMFVVSAYLGSFAPVNVGPTYGLATNYLGDPGLSEPFGFPSFFQIAAPLHSQIVIVITELLPNTGLDVPFNLLVEGYLDTEYNDIPDYHPPNPVPEPTTSVLFGSGLAISALVRRMRSRKRA